MGWLFGATKAGRVQVAGMDSQVGGVMGRYSEQGLGGELSSGLAADRRRDCQGTLDRHSQWAYDDTHPVDTSARPRLRACLRDIDDTLDATADRAPAARRAMVDSCTSYFGFADGDRDGRRDQAMYGSLIAHPCALAGGHPHRGLVREHACAEVAGRREAGGSSLRQLYKETFGARAAAIGFSAREGSEGRVGGHGAVCKLGPAAPDMLEARAYAATDDMFLFLDHAQWHAPGKVSARALVYGQPHTLGWSKLLDGMIVLREERAARATP